MLLNALGKWLLLFLLLAVTGYAHSAWEVHVYFMCESDRSVETVNGEYVEGQPVYSLIEVDLNIDVAQSGELFAKVWRIENKKPVVFASATVAGQEGEQVAILLPITTPVKYPLFVTVESLPLPPVWAWQIEQEQDPCLPQEE